MEGAWERVSVKLSFWPTLLIVRSMITALSLELLGGSTLGSLNV